ncbi:MAG TPA: TIM barrel protein [Candidatus Solibacter sp.]|nr:TIM barrel protein [Candidatus Solibacter sp.]
MLSETISRRGFLAATAGAALYGQSKKHVPVGLLIYAVLADWKKDFDGTLKAVAQMGYEGVELTQYESWTPARAKEVRALLDGIRLKVFATHTEPEYFVPGDKMKAMIELNQILGAQTVCCVRGLGATPTGIGYHAKAPAELDAWKELTDVLQRASETLKQHKMACSFHNHAVEFQAKDGVKPIDILAKSKGLVFHIDVNVCRRAGSDPVAFMKQYPGKTECLLLTDGPPDANRHAPLFGKGDTSWKEVFAAAESVGGIKYYLLTHGATEMTPLETVKRDLEQYRLIHG